ncbi:MAG: transaldolase [Epsilonproteobacteria bacterium]|nr:transaldolase [Campylobacterota bacterium]NPA88582.1 transaldolase [Campylobacterota bacterium]
MAEIWADYLDREFLEGKFKKWVEDGLVTGITSNPAIFSQAFRKGIYQKEIEALKGKEPEEIYKEIAVKELQRASDILSPVYEEGKGGFASIEVNPRLIDDWKGSVDEGLEFWERIGRPNLMIKVPANSAGYKAMEELSKRGVNVNATLIFSPTQAMESYNAISKGSGKGVVSIFVSRFDRKLNNLLKMKGLAPDRVGFFNAIKIYNQLVEAGIDQVKPLFASTGVKQEYLPKDYYVENLNLPGAILTLPPDVIEAIEGKELEESFPFQTKHIDAFFSFLTPAGINLQQVYDELFQEGVVAFQKAFDEMMEGLRQ